MVDNNFYIWASLGGQTAGCGDAHEAFRAITRSKTDMVTVSLTERLAAFRQRYPDTTQTFGIDAFAAAVGLSRAGVNHWMARGVCLPDAVPRSGRGKRRRWSWSLTFLGSVLADLSRNGIGIAVLAAVAEDFVKAGKRKSHNRPKALV